MPASTIKLHVSHTYGVPPAVVCDAGSTLKSPAVSCLRRMTVMSSAPISIRMSAAVSSSSTAARPATPFTVVFSPELKRPQRMVFSFSVEEHDHNCDRVEINIEPLGGGSRLTLTHEMCAEWAEHEEKTRQGWAHVVEGLGRELEQQQFKATG